jgi:hypothetical protein
MLFFRSEDMARAWCARRNVPLRPLVTMPQLWKMAVTWYGTRLETVSRRPQPDEIRGIFAAIGLDDPFWDPRADAFGA